MRLLMLLPLLAGGLLIAGEAVAVPAAPAGSAIAPDPSLSVVAEGASIYRQRDLDALLMVSMRHARNRLFAPDGKSATLSSADETQMRQVLIQAFTARESLIAALAGLPASVSPTARDAIVHDLLAYRAEPNPRAPAPGAAPAALAAAGPVLVRLPPATITRLVEGSGRRQLTIALALAFPDATAAKAMEPQAPVIQDAVLTTLRGMGPSIFLDPDHVAVKDALVAAIRAKVPAFPQDGLLIPQLETGPADQSTDR